jgi:hypothetical protein
MLKVFLTILLALPVNADEEKYIAKLGKFHKDNQLKIDIIQWATDQELIHERWRDDWGFTPQASSEQFIQSCRLLRERFEECKDAPWSSEARRFPPPDEIMKILAFNKQYEQNLEMQQMVHWNKEWFDDALRETRQLYGLWSKIAEGQGEWVHPYNRRLALKEVMNLIGKEAFYSGPYPPYVPLWRFQEIR